MSLLQLPLGPLQLFLQHGDLSGQVLPRRLVILSLVRPRLVRVQPGLGLVQAGLGDLELSFERGDVLFLLEDGLLELWERRRKVEGSTCQVLFLWIAKDQQESGIAHVLVGLFSLLGTLLGRLDLGAELVDFLQNDDNDVGQPWISPRLQHVRGI